MHDTPPLTYTDALVQSPTKTITFLTEASPQVPMTQALILGRNAHRYLAQLHAHRRAFHSPPVAPHDVPLFTLCRALTPHVQNRYGTTAYVELRLGCARVDHILYCPSGESMLYTIIDYKYLPALSERDSVQISETYRDSHQLMHYTWAFSQFVGLWYRRSHFLMRRGIALLSLDPEPYFYVTTWITQKEDLEHWLDKAIKTWYTMRDLKSKSQHS